MDPLTVAKDIAVYFIPFLFALCFHEWAHGMMAKLKGDRTAEMMGRLTLNPVAHMDLFGTLILPVAAIVFHLPIFFGWAKPVPVSERNLKNPRSDLFWIALAGPASNVFLALVATGLIALIVAKFPTVPVLLDAIVILQVFIMTNLFLAIFNLIPVHPLDGGKVLARFLPEAWNRRLEQNEAMMSMILMVLVMSGSLRFLAVPVLMIHSWLLRAATGGYL